MSLVNAKKIEKDPRNLAYLFPSIPVVEYKRRTDEYYHHVCLRALESVVEMTGHLLVPASCVHWEKKKKYRDRRVKLFTHAYYVLQQTDLSKSEYERYREMIEEN